MNLVKSVRRFLRRYFFNPLQRVFRGWSNSDLWNLYSHLAKIIYPRLKSYVKSYRKGKFVGLYPGLILQEYKELLISEGYVWDEIHHNFTDSKADERLQEIWLGILESMLCSFEWAAKDEPVPLDCYKPNPLYKPKADFLQAIDDGNRYQINPEHGLQKIDSEAYNQFSQKIQEGFNNFGKYYQCLWD